MKTLKSLLLGSSVAVMAATGAQAADLIAEPAAEYVRVCDAFGTGFYYIPGTETCLRISGNIRYFAFFQTNGGYYGAAADADEDDEFTYNMEALFRVRFDARTQTELGTLRGFTEFQHGFGGGVQGDNNTSTRYAFVQLGGLTAGQTNSFFRGVGTSDLFYTGPGSETQRLPLIAYTYVAGNGISATLSLEDPNNSQEPSGEFDNSLPSLVANVRVDQAWGSAQLSGAYLDNDDGDAGWAVRAGVAVNVGTAGSLAASAAYGEAADYYVIGSNVGSFTDAAFTNEATSYSMFFDYTHKVTSKFSAGIRAGYYNNEETNIDRFDIGGTLLYTPVSGVDFGLDIYYAEIADVPGENDGFYGVFRINRSF